MNKCIFCLSIDKSKFNTKEHVFPESLGGDDWALLPDGLFCDDCQNKFGSTIEQQALADYPFVLMRTLMGIPTKKNKTPWFRYPEGFLYSAGEPGKIIYEPNDFFRKSKYIQNKIHTIVPAYTRKPEFLLRTLLKIGLETIAVNDQDLIFKEKFNAARRYALTGEKECIWFYAQRQNDELMNLYINGKDWEDSHCFSDIHYEDDGLIFMHMRVYYIEFLVPLIENVESDPNDLLENNITIIKI